jgi:hypothetical protein
MGKRTVVATLQIVSCLNLELKLVIAMLWNAGAGRITSERRQRS